MPHRRSWLAVVVLALVTLVIGSPAGAVPFDNRPKILLHLRGTTTKNVCNVGLLSNCATAVIGGSLATPGVGPYYFAYVLTARGDMPNVAGLQFGIEYQDGLVGNAGDGAGLDIFQWVNCATLEWTANIRPWPEPGGSTLLTWDATTVCQYGETAVAGYFYVGAYGSDVLRLVPRPIDQKAKLANCLSVERELQPFDLGSVAFSPGGVGSGCNPCVQVCEPPGTPPDTTPPGIITLLAGSVGATTVDLSWLAPDEDGPGGYGRPCTSYDLRRSTSPITDASFNSAILVTNLPVPRGPGFLNSKTVSGLQPSTTYYFAIKAFDEAMNAGPISNVLQVTLSAPPDGVAPAAVTNLSIAGVTTSSFLLNWTAPGDDGNTGQAAAYDVRYSVAPVTSSNFGNAEQATGEPTPSPAGTPESFELSGLAQGTRYYVALRTLDERPNASALSNVVNALTLTTGPPDTTAPSAVTDMVVTGTSLSQVSLEWTTPGDDSLSGRAVMYDLRWSVALITPANFATATPVSGEPVPLQAGLRQGMTVGGLTAGVRYFFAMKTGDEVPNWSGLSNVVEQQTNRTVGNAKLMLHVTAPTTKSVCLNGQLADCHNGVTKGDLAPVGGSGPFYFIYLLATEFNELGGLQCGITYDGGRSNGDANLEAIDVFSWTLCASVELVSSGWPRPGGGNLIVWDGHARCQTEATAVAGYFYMAAYSADAMRIIPRPVDGLAKVANCGGVEALVPENFVGSAQFSAGATLNGANPCGAEHGVNIQHSTWSRIKTLVGH